MGVFGNRRSRYCATKTPAGELIGTSKSGCQCDCRFCRYFIFFFNDTATTEIYTLSLHDALPIYRFKGELTVADLAAVRRMDDAIRDLERVSGDAELPGGEANEQGAHLGARHA